MDHIIHWLLEMETLAFNLYDGCAHRCKVDAELLAALAEWAQDEREHLRVIELVGKATERLESTPSSFFLAPSTRASIERPLREGLHQLEARTLKQEVLLKYIVDVELSEWNRIYLTVVKAVKNHDKHFQTAAADMQQHLDEIVYFARRRGLNTVHQSFLERIWDKRVLLVEDDPVVRTVLSTLLETVATVDSVEGGEQAIEISQGTYYDVWVSDYHMPGMDGLQLFQLASRDDPQLSERFVFLSANPPEKLQQFCMRHNLPLLTKPVPMRQLLGQVSMVFERRTKQTAVFA